MSWWNDPYTILLWVCPLAALLTGLLAGVVSRNWGFGLLTGAMAILIPLLMFEAAVQILLYAPFYALIGLLGSAVGWWITKPYRRNQTLTEQQPRFARPFVSESLRFVRTVFLKDNP